MRHVSDVMSSKVHTVKLGQSVGLVRDMMLDGNIHGIPVIDKDGSVAGIVTSSDLVEELPPDLGVAAVMSEKVVSVGPDATLVDAARAMLDGRIHHLMVLDGDQVAGIVSSFDLLRELAGEVEAQQSSTVAGRRTAQPGDLIVIRSHKVGFSERAGRIVEARGADGGPPYLVQWHDDPHDEPHEVLFFPGSDAEIRPAAEG
jgi:signal-transduction protein with cAMP-binding, CBS, and nucleotidyltransferase domain